MNRAHPDPEQVLDRILAEIREQRLDAGLEAAAADRVWSRLAAETASRQAAVPAPRTIQSCADFQALIGDHLAGKLSAGTRLLFQDHVGECVPCRRALKNHQTKAAARPGGADRAAGSHWTTRAAWRLAAAAVVVLALVGISFRGKALSFRTGGLIRIEALEGDVQRVGRTGSTPVAVGDVLTLDEGEALRTGRDSGAILTLADRSRVEMRQRSQLAVQEERSWLPGRKTDGVLDLERGGIIVEASEQGSGHLYVDTDDCRVAVTGTVFSVSHGTKGSRVSVVEGEVHVDLAGTTHVLRPGEQQASSAAIRPVPVEQDIAWSRNSRQYLELLREMRAVGREMDAALRAGLRYDTALLDLAPADTVVWVGVPNISGQLADAYEILRQRVASSDLLREWWERSVASSGELERALEKIRSYGQYLGPELGVSLGLGSDREVSAPLLYARLTDATAFRAALERDIAALAGAHPEVRLQLLDTGPAAAVAIAPGPPSGDDADALVFWVDGDLVAASPNLERLHGLEAAARSGAAGNLSGSFRERLAGEYREGVEWIVGVDLERLVPHEQAGGPLERLGVLDVQHVIAERTQLEDDTTESRVVLTFSQPRRQLAAWLAEPAPMGALDYVGPEANFLAAVVIKRPEELVDELFEFLGQAEPGFQERLAAFEAEQGVNVRADFAAPLGGEIAAALDGPMLPTPAWKLVLEVYDPARLQRTIEWLVERLQQHAQAAGGAGFKLERQVEGSQEYFRLTSLDTGLEAAYVFDHGYLVAAPSRGLIERALQARRTGVSLPASPGFMKFMPRDGHVDFSGVVYHNLAPVLGPLSRVVQAGKDAADPDQQQLIQALAAETGPGMALLYGEERQITLSGINEGGLFGSSLASLSGFGGLLGVQQSLVETLASSAGSGE